MQIRLPIKPMLKIILESENLSEEEIKKKKENFGKMAKGLEKGNFTSWCQQNGFTKASFACIQKAKKVAKETNDKTLMKRATLANTFKMMARKRKKQRSQGSQRIQEVTMPKGYAQNFINKLKKELGQSNV